MLRRTTVGLVCALLVTIVGVRDSGAQETGTWKIEGRGGIAVPGPDLSDLQDIGGNAAVGIAYQLHPRLALRVDGSVDILQGKNLSDEGILLPVPDMTLWHYVGGVDLRLTSPGASRFDVTTTLEAGATTLDTDTFVSGENAGLDFSQTYFSAAGGLQVGYVVRPDIRLFIGGEAHLVLTDEDETIVFRTFSSEVAQSGFDSVWTFPVQAGISVGL